MISNVYIFEDANLFPSGGKHAMYVHTSLHTAHTSTVSIHHLHVALDPSHPPYSLGPPNPPRTAHSILVKEQYLATKNLARCPTDRNINHTIPEPHQRQHERRDVVEAKVLRVTVDEGVDSVNGGRDLSKRINIA